MCRAKGPGEVEFLRQQIDSDDLPCTSQRRSLNDVEPHASAADDGDRTPRVHLSGVNSSADAGHGAATDKASAVQRDILADLDGTTLRYDRLFGERRGKGKVEDVLPIFLQAGGAVQ